MSQRRVDIPESRKMMYYGGLVLTGIGVILFLSGFFTSFRSFGGLHQGPSFTAPIIGFILIGIGQVLRTVGARGLAGSGVILDPQKAREDLEPYARSAGGLLKDALEETDLAKSSQPVVKLRCRNCQTLNDETANFCQNCGQEL